MLTLLYTLLALYAGLCALMWAKQRDLLYFPDRNIEAPAAYGLSGFSDVRFPAADGTMLQAWYHPPREGFPLVVYFHGNGGHLGYRAHTYGGMADSGFGVLALSYRGYGKSQGNPTGQGLEQDADATLRYIKEELKFPLQRVVLFGESLGCNLAVREGAANPVGGVVLQAPFLSALKRASEIYYFLPVSLLMKDTYRTDQVIGTLRAPLLILHGELDAIVPVAHGEALFQAANQPKEIKRFPALGHNDFSAYDVVPELLRFSQAHGLMEGPTASPAP